MNTKHFLLNLQSDSTLSKLWNFGGGDWIESPTPLGKPLIIITTTTTTTTTVMKFKQWHHTIHIIVHPITARPISAYSCVFCATATSPSFSHARTHARARAHTHTQHLQTVSLKRTTYKWKPQQLQQNPILSNLIKYKLKRSAITKILLCYKRHHTWTTHANREWDCALQS